MAQYTRFYKNAQIYLKIKELRAKLYQHEIGEIYLDNLEIVQIETEADELQSTNVTDYINLFRTWKKEEDGTCTEDEIFSREQCFEWLDKNSYMVSFKRTYSDTIEQEKHHKENAIIHLNRFWNKYPDGVICFG